MAHADDLLRAYAGALGRLTGAGGVTLFLPSAGEDPTAPLVHEGPLLPVPELADLPAAVDLERRTPAAAESFAEDGSPAPWVRPSALAEGRLIELPLGTLADDAAGSPRMRRGDGCPPAGRRRIWIGLRFDAPPGTMPSGPAPLDRPVPLSPVAAPEAWHGFLGLASTLAGHARLVSRILNDPVTGLPGRAEVQEDLRQSMARAREAERPLALLLVNPDDFAQVNDRFGREAGDRVLREIAARLRKVLRRSDRVGKFGGAIFTCLLPDTGNEQAGAAAAKVLDGLGGARFLDGEVTLGFSIGASGFEPPHDAIQGPLELIWRADRALNAAKRAGGSRVKLWRPGSEVEATGNLDRLTGIFTGNMTRDYRNMVLLWDSVNAVTSESDPSELARKLLERLHGVLKPRHAAIFIRDEERGLHRLVAVPGAAGAAEPGVEQRELMERACAEGRSLHEADGSGFRAAVPMRAGEASLGCLWLVGAEGAGALDSPDLVFLGALASQMAIAIDRARLAEQERARQEDERTRLRAEVDQLRRAIQASKLAYRSAQMEELLATARRIAPTDATVLITGESGTGKELLARTIHELSQRRERPLVVVDCGAIASSLIDSELFGHAKGAFTGAQDRKVGRLAEAEGATVLLDEIGELPLDVQSKLLRFVQERQLTPVGDSRPRTVDVRIIAATNVDLAERVRQGRFREDLYHRLNVMRLGVPALRERPDDILFLAEHFLERYAATYGKPVRRLAEDATTLLLRHDWPGNVRELQNRMMQAVLLSEGSELDAGDFRGLQGRQGGPPAEAPARAEPPPSAVAETVPGPRRPEPDASPAERLRTLLAREVESALEGGRAVAVPLGKWLEEDLVLAADAAAGGVARRGAAMLGLPETTFRRRLRKVAASDAAGLLPRTATWSGVRDALGALVHEEPASGENLLALVERILLAEIVARAAGDVRTCSTLLGVTQPTFKRRLAAARGG